MKHTERPTQTDDGKNSNCFPQHGWHARHATTAAKTEQSNCSLTKETQNAKTLFAMQVHNGDRLQHITGLKHETAKTINVFLRYTEKQKQTDSETAFLLSNDCAIRS